MKWRFCLLQIKECAMSGFSLDVQIFHQQKNSNIVECGVKHQLPTLKKFMIKNKKFKSNALNNT